MCHYREATENDFEAICKLIKTEEELFLIYPNGQFPLTIKQLQELSKVRKELTVVVKNNKIIGFANLYNYQENESAFIGNVVIEKNHRGKGLGKALVTYMLQLALNKHALREVRISVFNDNTPALLLYASFGFTPFEIEQRLNPQGKKVALIHMRIKPK